MSQVAPSLPSCRPLRVFCTSSGSRQQYVAAAATSPTRRSWLATGAAALAAGLVPLLPAARPGPALADDSPSSSTSSSLEIVVDHPGSGTAAARIGDLVLVHYVGKVQGESPGDGALFDSTRGGQMYRDGGIGVLRPVVIRLGGSPVPGICAGLQQGIEGMTVGGRRTFLVPASLGFGSGTVLGPYGVVPGGSTLRYEVELLRLSRRGPDALMTGISQCGGGFVNERTTGCADITLAEYV